MRNLACDHCVVELFRGISLLKKAITIHLDKTAS